jgi:polysaccharide chain length determinant protein (PEP-CTERM system associated)
MHDDSATDIDVKRYIGIILRRRYTAIGVALAVLSVFTWGSFVIPKVYEASATVSIENVGIIKPLIQGVGFSVSMQERQSSIRNRITSRNIVERVIDKVGLTAKQKDQGQKDEIAASVQKSLVVTMRSSSEREPDLFTVAYRGSDPKVVRDLLAELVREFIDDSVQFQRTDAVGAYDFIESQLNEYKEKLESSDKRIREFRERNPQMIPQSENTIAGRIESFQTARIDSEIRLKELTRKRESLRQQLSGEKELTVAFVTREGSPESRLSYLNNQLMVLMTKYTDNYPEVIKTKNEIDELQKQIAQPSGAKSTGTDGEMRAVNPVYRQIKEEMQRTETDIESLKARMDELAKQQDVGQKILGQKPKEQEEWSKLQRDRTVYQKVYDDLLQKLENARVSKNMELADKSTKYRVVDPPLLPRIPVAPNRILLIIAGLLLGVASGAGTAIGLDYLNFSFKDEDALHKALNLPVLAAVPSVIIESDIQAEKALDKKVFKAAIAYLSLIGIVFIVEIFYRMGTAFVR